MTSNDNNEIEYLLDIVMRSTANTGLIHESFYKDNFNDYTRSWFAWANGLFGEWILQLVWTKPELLISKGKEKEAKDLIKEPISVRAIKEGFQRSDSNNNNQIDNTIEYNM
jgi:hypothetical protein